MSQSPVWGRVLVAGCIVCCLAFALNADGQAGKPQVFATVDVEKVNSEFIERKTEEANLRALDSRFRQRIQRRQAMPFLDEEEHKTIDSLEEKDNKTAEETKRLKDLTDKGNALNAQVTTLRTKEDSKLTPEEKEALRKFESDFQALQGRLQHATREVDEARTELQMREAEIKRLQTELAEAAGWQQRAPAIAEFGRSISLVGETKLAAANSAIAMTQPGELPWKKAFAGAKHFHTGGITPGLSDSAAKVTTEGLQAAKAAGLTTSFDLNFRARLWTEEKAQQVITPMCPLIDILITTEEDTDRVFKIKGSTYEDVAKKLVDKFHFKVVAITLRENLRVWQNNWTAMAYADGQFYKTQT